MKQFSMLALFALWALVPVVGQNIQVDSVDTRQRVCFETSLGTFVIALFDETPLHRDNFLRLVSEHYYDSLLFHRTVGDFVVQTGDPDSRHAQPGAKLGEGGPDYEVAAEICYPRLAHFRGAVGAAREDDLKNPERRSSASQFYVVWGKRFGKAMMERARQIVAERTDSLVVIPEAYDSLYWERGGTPTLDGQYTVFGEIVSGLDVIGAMHIVETDANQRPLQDVRIKRAYVVQPTEED